MTDGDASVLIAFLDAQRTRALNIIAGLDERQLRTAVLPSGWTPLGMIEHLGHAERGVHTFRFVNASGEGNGPVNTGRVSRCGTGNQSTPPAGRADNRPTVTDGG
jgi:hypothetical protein